MRELRRDAKMLQEDLAAAVGVSRSTIAGIESGNDRGGIATMIAIADHFRVPMDWLLGRSVPPGGPLCGQFVEESHELILLRFWRSLSHEERRVVIGMLSIKDQHRSASRQ